LRPETAIAGRETGNGEERRARNHSLEEKMSEPQLDLQSMAARLQKLEKRDRIWRLIVVIALLLVIDFRPRGL